MTTKRVIVTADDFGLSEAVNEAVEIAHRDGILTTASLMVGAPAAADAVRRAKALPSLRVGLHLVVIEGPGVLPAAEVPLLLRDGAFPSDQLRLGVDYFFRPAVRRQLAAEIGAQFAAFAATGLALDHANAHKHMHLHPTVGRMMIEAGRSFNLRAIRIPAEPAPVMRACGEPLSLGARAMHAGTALLRRQARRGGLFTNDHAFGIAWSGHMNAARLLQLVPHLPPGVSEIYLHPATRRDPLLTALMPDYEHAGELAALLDSRVADALAASDVTITNFSEEAGRWTR